MFNEKYNNTLSMFGLQHIITIVIIIGILAGAIYLARKFREDNTKDKIFRYTLGSFLLVSEITYHIWTILNGGYSLNMIPFTGFCAFVNVLTIYYLFTNNKKVANMVAYYSTTGMIFSVIFIDMNYGFPHFRYFHYFLVHFGFFVATIYYLFSGKLTITRKNANLASILLFSYTLFMWVFDLTLGFNWFYLNESPVREISDFFGKYLYPVLWMAFIAGLVNLWSVIYLKIDRKFNQVSFDDVE